MSLLVYGVCPAGEEIAGRGLEGQRLDQVQAGDLAVVVSQHGDEPPAPREESLREYERVVAAVAAGRPLLPARFGSLVPDAAAATSFMRRESDSLRRALEEVRGAVELAVRVVEPASAPSGAGDAPGTDYMRTQLARHHRAREIAGRLERLGDLTRATKLRLTPDRETLLAGAYLVEPERIEAFTGLLALLDGDLEGVEVHCTGPWPAYSFTPAAAP